MHLISENVLVKKIWSRRHEAAAADVSQHQAGTRTIGGSAGSNELRSRDVGGEAQAMLMWQVFIACSCFSSDVHYILDSFVFHNELTT